MKKIVFFDIDGTIISETTRLIPDSTREAINTLRANGHLAFINTGRPISEITPTIKDLGFDGYICGCGTYVEYNNKILLHKKLGKKLSKEIALDMNKYDFEGILEGSKDIYWDYLDNIHNDTVLALIDQHKYEGFYKGLTWHTDNIDIDKLVIFLKETSDFSGFYKKYSPILDFIKRNETFYELVPKGYSKGTGINFICDYLNINHEDTYAIGDSTNDLPMLDYVPHSIAMGNSAPDLFKSVEYITSDVDNDGIFNALKHYGLIG